MFKPKPIPPGERPEPRQVVWTSLLVIAAILPLMRYLDWRIDAFLLLTFAVRLAGLRWRAAVPGPWVRALLALAGIANCLYANQTLVGQDGGTALLTTMIALKLLELETKRDLRLTVILLGFFSVAQFLFDQSFPLAVYLGAVTIGAVTLLVDLNGGLGDTDRRAALRMAVRLSLQAAPLTLVLFVLFPRLNAPLWSLGVDSEKAQFGMSDSMEPGAISELVSGGGLAFRARFDRAPPDQNRLYWRGIVLWEMDGRRWSPGALSPAANAPSRLLEAADPIGYEIVLEPTRKKWLFALDMPTGIPDGTRMDASFLLSSNESVDSAKRYRARSALAYRTAEPDARVRELALRLPGNITPRMRELVAGWQGGTGGDWDLVQRGLAFFNKESFHYTLLPPALGANPADEFLFETRRGFCEHYASSFALLMRVGGVPSRVVLGYLGGERNEIGDYHMVWQSDAHAWVEVLIAGRGWVRVDPTAAVDPARVDNRSAAQVLGSGSSARFELPESGALAHVARNLRLLADTFDATWQNWVLDFSTQEQFALLERLGLEDYGEYGLAVLMLVAVSLTLGLTVLAMLRDRARADPLDAQYAVFCQRLARAGLPRGGHEGPLDFGRRVAAQRPDLASAVERFLALYVPARFGPPVAPGTADRLARELRGFHPRRGSRGSGGSG